MRRERQKGLLIVFTGDGKGKTTAALGMALRALGHGMKVRMIQFVKGTWRTGESRMASRLRPDFELLTMGRGFLSPLRSRASMEEHAAAAQEAFAVAIESLRSGSWDIVILDEVIWAHSRGLLTWDQMKQLIEARPPHVHLVMTGRGATSELIELADLATEMKPLKHPYERGVRAQAGVEF
jgi:cob(I)alamin adenosyltransferase